MADYVDLRPVLNKVENVSAKVDQLTNYTVGIGNSVEVVNQKVGQLDTELRELSQKFIQMMSEQQRIANLQQATTELVRVRQQIENEFSSYKTIRETMLGVLQATDLALVKQSTISRVSEELMLSTPDYWLAPCLVAIAAWIGNDKDLADRAIKEAVKRDKERTSLTMALVCRRNQRTSTCYEWLRIYFSTQKGSNFSEGSFTYVDAYLNGVFGPDENHMCDDYIAKWMSEVQQGEQQESFEQQQAEVWREYCQGYAENLDETFPDLRSNVSEYTKINDYLGRIYSVNAISSDFKKITTAYVDREKLVKDIDAHLITLVSRYDSHEEPLRKEEEKWQEIKNQDGDIEKANAIIKMRELERKERTLNLVQQMTNVIKEKGQTSSMSEKKTAVSFLSSYIKKGFDSYMTEKKEEFPQSITLNVDGWSGQSADGNNASQLCTDYSTFMDGEKKKALDNLDDKKSKKMMIIAIVAAALGIILGIGTAGVFTLIGLVVAAVFLVKMQKEKKKLVDEKQKINEEYQQKVMQGQQKIHAITGQWQKAKQEVQEYNSKEKTDIIA